MDNKTDQTTAGEESSGNPVEESVVVKKAKKVDRTNVLIIAGSILISGLIIAVALSGALSRGVATEGQVAGAFDYDKSVKQLIKKSGVRYAKIEQCVEEGEQSARVERDLFNGQDTGGRGTPWNILVYNGGELRVPISGAYPKEVLEQIIQEIKDGRGAEIETEFIQGVLANRNDPNYAVPGTEVTAEDIRAELANVLPVEDIDHVKGDRDNPFVVIEYSDFDCPFCQRFHATMNEIVEDYDDVSWVYRHMPIPSLHPNAAYVSNVSECVRQEGGEEAFWKFTDNYYLVRY